MDSVGPADARGVHVLAGPRYERVAVAAGPAHEGQARLRELKRKAGVEDVGGGEPVVHPAPGRPDRLGDHVDEGRDVVVGHLLALQ